jgi:hypothetical protein
MSKFIEWCADVSRPIIKNKVEEQKQRLSKLKGFIEDVTSEKEEIDNGIHDNGLMKSRKIKKIDLVLKTTTQNFASDLLASLHCGQCFGTNRLDSSAFLGNIP